MKQKTQTIAIIGAGNWGKKLIHEFDKVTTIKGVLHGKNIDTAIWLTKEYPQFKIYKSIEEIICDPQISAVVIASPIHTHFEYTKLALNSGKHVFVEKPLAQSLNDSITLVDIAQKNMLKLSVGFIYLHSEIFQKMKNLIRNEDILKVEFHWEKYGTFGNDIIDNLLCHEIAITLTMFGEIVEISGSSIEEDVVNITTTLADSIPCVFFIDRKSDNKVKRVSITTKSGEVFAWINDALYVNDKLIHRNETTPLELECKHFIEDISKNNTPLTNGELGREVARVVERLR